MARSRWIGDAGSRVRQRGSETSLGLSLAPRSNDDRATEVSMGRDWNLERFVQAQDGVLDDVLDELAHGRKQSHWMWFVFPQIRGLGRTPMSIEYALSSLDEAKAYLRHPVLAPRLNRCTELVLAADPADTANRIFGSPDDMKFQSCM